MKETVLTRAHGARWILLAVCVRLLAVQGKGNIFTTDLALAVLMSAPRSVASWDIVVQRSGGCLYLGVLLCPGRDCILCIS